MKIRLLTLEDSKKYHQLILEAYIEPSELGVDFAASVVDLDAIKKHIQHNAVYILEIGEDFVSTLSLRYSWGNNPGPYGLPHLGWLATAVKYKKRGFNLHLFSWVEREILIGTLKLPAVTLGTAENHPWLVEYYTKLGFEVVGHAYLGRGHKTIYMKKTLINYLNNDQKGD